MQTGQQIQVHTGTFHGKVGTVIAKGIEDAAGWLLVNFGGPGDYWVWECNVTVLEAV